MPSQEVDNAPVEQIGGPQSQGPWPDDLQEIATGEAYQRPVELSDGTLQQIPVTVTSIEQIIRRDGTETDGYIVTQHYDDPSI